MSKIVRYIRKVEPAGASVDEISNQLKCNMETAGIYCMELQKKGLITRKTKVSKYHLTGKIGNFPELIPMSFGMQAYREILDWKYVTLNNKFCNSRMCTDKIIRSRGSLGHGLKYLSGEKEIIQLALFEFASRIGAFIMYNLLQAINPNPNIRYTRMATKGSILKGSDEFAMMWIDNAINPDVILHEFSRMTIVESGIVSDSESYVIGKEVWNSLIHEFEQLYPEIFEQLERLKDEEIR